MTDDNGGVEKEIDNARERAWKLEQELAQILHQHNEETSGLHKEIAKLRASLEQCEAEKQKLEYILFAAKQEMCKLEESGLEREQQLAEITETLQSRITQLTRQSQEWNNTLDSMQQSRAQERLESQRIIAAKEEQLTNAGNRSRELEAELENLRSSLTSHVGSLEDLQGKLTTLEVECEEKTAAVLQQGRELQQANQQERYLMEQLQEKTKEVKGLEEAIQAEKAAHLDCKFSAEIAQLRLKELECKTEADKNFILEISATLEQANENISKLQQQLDNENCKVIELSDKLLNKELEYNKLEQHSQEQLKEKDTLHNTSLQQAHQKTKSLQNKLDHSSQREADLKDQLKAIKHDLLALLSTLGGKGYSAEATPINLLQLLKGLITQQQQKIRSQDQNLRVAGENQEQLRAECMRYKEVLESRSSAVSEAEQQLAQYSDQVSRLQEEMIKMTTSHNEKCQKLQMQLDTTASQRKAENESHCRYLQSLYSQMTSRDLRSHETVQQTELSDFITKPPSNDWAHLSTVVAKETASICDRIKNLANEVSKLETSREQLKDRLVAEQQSHQQDVDQLSSQQVHQLEQCDKYQRQIEALCTEVKNLQTSCYDNTNQISQLTETNQMLTKEHAQCEAAVEQMSAEKCLLVPALAMLVGTIFPLLARQHQLILQKAVLSRQLQQLEKLQNCVVELTELLESVSDSAPPSRPCPLMRFRKIALVVLATNRMMLLHRHSNCLLTGHLSSSPVVTKVTMHSGGCTGIQWLNDHTLMDDVTQSLSSLKLNQWDPFIIKGYYCQLLGQLSKHFASTTVAMDCWSHTSYPFPVTTNKQSLWQRLTHATSQRNTRCRNNPEQLSELLRSQLLTLTAKLHDGELDRHNLHQQLLEANQNCQQLSAACKDALTMATTVEKLQHEIQLMVPAEQYDEVNNLLQLSQQRHNEQEDVISRHVSHIQQLDQRLVHSLAELKQKEQTLTKATLELHQLKEQVVLQDRQLKDVSLQCQNLQQQLARVQHSLTTVISEQQALEQFMGMATSAFKQSQRDINNPTASSQQLQPLLDLLMDEQSKLVASSSSSNCQEMIMQLLSAHQASLELITSLRAQLDSYRVHTNALKGELSAACRRQLASMAASLDYQEDELSLDKSNSQIATQGALLGVSMAKSLNMMQQD